VHYSCRTNITSIKKRRRHRDETAKDEERDTTPDLLLKHPDTTLATYI
jgi:hypothetical protein